MSIPPALASRRNVAVAVLAVSGVLLILFLPAPAIEHYAGEIGAGIDFRESAHVKPQATGGDTGTAAKKPATAANDKTATDSSSGDATEMKSTAVDPDTTGSTSDIRGIDVSHNQGRVDWSSVPKHDVDFVYLKATDGITFTDPMYQQNVRQLQALNLVSGAYHFFEPNDDPLAQAQHFLRTVRGARHRLPPVLDVEITKDITAETIRNRALAWLKAVEKELGCQPVIYTYGDFWNDNLGDEFRGYRLWLADYAAEPKLPRGVDQYYMWQYTQTGRVRGVNGHVDRSHFPGDQGAFLQGLCAEQEASS